MFVRSTPSTNISRRSSAAVRKRKALAYSGDAYHRRMCAMDSNSTITMGWGTASPYWLGATHEVTTAMRGNGCRRVLPILSGCILV